MNWLYFFSLKPTAQVVVTYKYELMYATHTALKTFYRRSVAWEGGVEAAQVELLVNSYVIMLM